MLKGFMAAEGRDRQKVRARFYALIITNVDKNLILLLYTHRLTRGSPKPVQVQKDY